MTILKTNAINKKLNNTVEIILSSSFLLSSFSPTYLTIPGEKDKVETPSKAAIKFLKFPTKAIPLGPRKTAKSFDVISPIPILIRTLKLFKEVILNRLVWIIFLINSNLIPIYN